jgi:hypothetical protein
MFLIWWNLFRACRIGLLHPVSTLGGDAGCAAQNQMTEN